MVWHADLEPLGHEDIVAVGWLEPGKEYRHGPVSPDFAPAICDLLADPWQPFAYLGWHSCGFCRLSGGSHSFRLGNRSIEVGRLNLYVPTESKLYLCPSMAIHYADAHEYAPPEEFIRAVSECPPMRSMEYLKAIKPFAARLRDLHP
jgi:hypothetical protein